MGSLRSLRGTYRDTPVEWSEGSHYISINWSILTHSGNRPLIINACKDDGGKWGVNFSVYEKRDRIAHKIYQSHYWTILGTDVIARSLLLTWHKNLMAGQSWHSVIDFPYGWYEYTGVFKISYSDVISLLRKS
jgi:hypothetical protein